MADLGHWGGRGREKVVFEKKIRVVFFAIVFHFIFFSKYLLNTTRVLRILVFSAQPTILNGSGP